MRDARLRALRGALLLCICLGLTTGLSGAPPPAFGADPEAEPSIADRLAGRLRVPSLRGAQVAALVVRERDGEVLFARTPDRALTPASNVKILTALATLDAFGPSHQFETVIRSPAPPDATGTVARLLVRGGGDPALNSEDWWRLAAALRHEGVRRVEGDIVLDDSAFDAERWHPSWGATSARAYHAPVGALTANYGSFAVTVRPGARSGDPVSVEIDPPVRYFKLSNGAVTGSKRARRSLVVDRTPGEGVEIVRVRGTARLGDEAKTYYRSVLDPTRYAGSVLRMQLHAVGIEVGGGVRVAHGEAAEHELLRFEGRPVSEIVKLFVKYSNNAVAESLVKNLAVLDGSPGSWEHGRPALRRRLLALGLDGEAFQLVDGSGLSYDNRVSPRLFVEALRMGRRSFALGPELVAALPIAATDGTLKKRAKGSRGEVRAKTGLLNRTTGLSGFAHDPDGELLVFSILVNGYRSGDEAAMNAVDGFIAEMVTPREPVPAAAR